MSENRTTLSELAKMGVECAVVAPSPDGKATLQERLDSLTSLRDEVIKRF